MGTLICKKERNMLKESDIIDLYPEMKGLLLKYDSITQKVLDEDIEISESVKELFSTGAYKKIIEVAYNEWVGESYHHFDDENGIKCSLCNHKNHWIYYIKNKNNGNRLNVGSDCIKNFPELKDEKGNTNADIVENNRVQRVKQQKEIERTKSFYVRFKNFDSRILYYEAFVKNSPYLVNFSLNNSVSISIERIREMRNKYIKGDITRGCFNDIDKEFLNLDRLITIEIPKCNKYLSKEKYACKKDVADWLFYSNKKHKENIIQKIRINNSCINKNTIREIGYIPFIKEHLAEYKTLTKDIFYDLRIHDRVLYVTIKNKFLSNCVFYSLPYEFMKNLGDIVFLTDEERKKRLKLDFLLSKIFLLDTQSEDNVFNLYFQLNNMFGGRYEFLFDYDKNKTYVVDRVSKKCVEFLGTRLLVKHLLIWFESKEIEKSCRMFFDNLKWKNLTQDDIDAISECRRKY